MPIVNKHFISFIHVLPSSSKCLLVYCACGHSASTETTMKNVHFAFLGQYELNFEVQERVQEKMVENNGRKDG